MEVEITFLKLRLNNKLFTPIWTHRKISTSNFLIEETVENNGNDNTANATTPDKNVFSLCGSRERERFFIKIIFC